MPEETLKIFAESDMTRMKDGSKIIASEYPAWYNRQLLDELNEDIIMLEWSISQGKIKEDKVFEARQKLDKLRKRMVDIEESVPDLDDKGRDSFAKVRKELGKEISAKMFSRSDMKKGLADSHEEARRMTEPSISLSPEAFKLAHACNVRVSPEGKVSRTGAEKIWKITSRYLDEQSNAESLRRD